MEPCSKPPHLPLGHGICSFAISTPRGSQNHLIIIKTYIMICEITLFSDKWNMNCAWSMCRARQGHLPPQSPLLPTSQTESVCDVGSRGPCGGRWAGETSILTERRLCFFILYFILMRLSLQTYSLWRNVQKCVCVNTTPWLRYAKIQTDIVCEWQLWVIVYPCHECLRIAFPNKIGKKSGTSIRIVCMVCEGSEGCGTVREGSRKKLLKNV